MTRRGVLLACISCALSTSGIRAQVQSSAEVRSIARCPASVLTDRTLESKEIFSDRGVTFECRTLRSLIDEAWLGSEGLTKVSAHFVNGSGHGSLIIQSPGTQRSTQKETSEGGPAWLDSELYTMQFQTKEITGPILQSVLANKFQVRVHRAVLESRSYALTVSDAGAHLRQVPEENCAPSLMNNPKSACGVVRRIDSHRSELIGNVDTLCRRFSTWLNRDVSNHTGLTGIFDMQLPFAPEDLNAGVLSGESFGVQFQVLSHAAETLGLGLETTTKSSERLMVDSAERPAGLR